MQLPKASNTVKKALKRLLCTVTKYLIGCTVVFAADMQRDRV